MAIRRFVGAALVVAAALLLFVPLPLSVGGRSAPCGPAVIAMAPSDPLPRTDPQYDRSEACYRRCRWFALAGLAAGIAGSVLIVKQKRL